MINSPAGIAVVRSYWGIKNPEYTSPRTHSPQHYNIHLHQYKHNNRMHSRAGYIFPRAPKRGAGLEAALRRPYIEKKNPYHKTFKQTYPGLQNYSYIEIILPLCSNRQLKRLHKKNTPLDSFHYRVISLSKRQFFSDIFQGFQHLLTVCRLSN